ncbi:MAG: DNA-directed RNA polymerase subunit D [Methanocellales archaeon]|nr:DNA-directed RNA polymerase subunit D [Methanocellales archaeon]
MMERGLQVIGGSETNIDIIELSDRRAKFILSGISPAFANALRRSAIAEVPILAIDDVNIYENTSVLFDEMLALRLGLIPLKTDLDSYVLRSECSCKEGCPLCQVSLTLSAEGPKVVYSGELKSSDPKVAPADENIPIIELMEGQKVVLEAIAQLGKGEEHAKWQPATCSYKNMPTISISKCNGCGACVEACPKGILKLNDALTMTNELDCSLCHLCEDVCELGAIHVGSDPASFVFNLESHGSLPAEEVILRAADNIKGKIKRLTKCLSKLS